MFSGHIKHKKKNQNNLKELVDKIASMLSTWKLNFGTIR